jgi:UDP-glucuronate 4-epimerase
MNILITGCAGFIGSHLTERLLEQNHSVWGIDNFDLFYAREIKLKNLEKSLKHQCFTFLEMDIRKPFALMVNKKKIDLVIHLAAKAGIRPSIEAPQEYIDTNITGTNNVLEWMKKSGISKLIFTSSSSVYGNNAQIPFIETDNAITPISPYAFTKRSCELLNFNYHSLYNLDILNLRLFTVYGERQRPDLAIYKFVKAISENKLITINGDGQSARDYTHVSDIVKGIESSVRYIMNNKGVYEIINLGNNHPVKLNELIDLMKSLTGKSTEIAYGKALFGEAQITHADIGKAKKMLGYVPGVKLENGISDFIEWFKKVNKN